MDRRIQAVISRMESEPSVKFAELAEMVRLSESRLRHLFKKETGVTPNRYLKEWRMRRAEFLLRTTYKSVKEIVRDLGLASRSRFGREFKLVFGVSPTTYRRRNGKTKAGSKRENDQ